MAWESAWLHNVDVPIVAGGGALRHSVERTGQYVACGSVCLTGQAVYNHAAYTTHSRAVYIACRLVHDSIHIWRALCKCIEVYT